MQRPSPFIISAQPVLRDRPPKGDGWLHEVKFDGYRAQLHKAGKATVIYSKNGRDFSNRFPGIVHAVLALPCKNAIIDAEIVVLKEDGSADFRALHSGNYTQDHLCAWCFDVLALDDADIRPLPLVVRKLKLGTLLKRYNHGSLRYSESFRDADKLLTECRRLGLEGSVSKKKERTLSVRQKRLAQGQVRSVRRRCTKPRPQAATLKTRCSVRLC